MVLNSDSRLVDIVGIILRYIEFYWTYYLFQDYDFQLVPKQTFSSLHEKTV